MKKSIANPNIAAGIILAAIIWTIPLLILLGCGKKAPPRPPRGNRPPNVLDLAYSISGNTIKLSWTIPKTSAKAKSPAIGFIIYRAQQSDIDSDCPDCPIRFLRIGDVLVTSTAPGQPEVPVVWTQTIEPGYRYLYKIKAYDDDGIRSSDSNMVDFRF